MARSRLLEYIVDALMIVLALVVVVLLNYALTRPRVCGDFDTQPEAQKAFESDPERYYDLDRDDNGIACQSMPDRKRLKDNNLLTW